MAWNGLMVKEFGDKTAKQLADRHETDEWTTNTLAFRGMDFANNYYGREIAKRLLAQGKDDFEARLHDESESFIRAGKACSIENYQTSRDEGSETPNYVSKERCGG